MVAYSFKERFVAPIRAGTKPQTIRADRKRHAKPGESLQLYRGMRTRQCFLIGTATCSSVVPIQLDLHHGRVESIATGLSLTTPEELDAFARRDGFEHWRDLLAFWAIEHGTLNVFEGVLITWRDFAPPTGRPHAGQQREARDEG